MGDKKRGSRTKGEDRYWKSVPDAPFVREEDLIEETFAAVNAPLWVIRPIVSAFMRALRTKIMQGSYIYLYGIGSLTPIWQYEKGDKVRVNYKRMCVRYRLFLSKRMKSHIKKATLREVPDALQKKRDAGEVTYLPTWGRKE